MFTEIVFQTDRSHADALTDSLLEAGALSATVEDADAGLPDEQPLFGEPGGEPELPAWNRSKIVALFDDQSDADAIVTEAFQTAGLKAVPVLERRSVANADWVRLTQAQFDPIHIGERLWIVPSWHDAPADALQTDSIILELDPGLAFGTGSHPTTRLCLTWLESHVGPGQSVIDYGCGSGILAIAAKKLGAGEVVGTDIDEQAIAASIDNAQINHCDVMFSTSKQFEHVPADIVVANILSNPLKVLAPLLCSLVAPDGQLVLSGVLLRQWEEVAAAYQPFIRLEVWRSEEDWVCLAGQKQVATA